MRWRILVCAGVVSGGAWAQLPPRVGLSGAQRELSLRQAVELALEKNLDIEIERRSVDLAEESLRGARGAFDPAFRWLPSLESRNLPTSSVLQGGGAGLLTENFHAQNFQLRQRTPWSGLQLGFDFDNTRSSTSNVFSSLNPVITSRMFLRLTQPLLRNRSTDRERAEIAIRQKRRELSGLQLEARVIEVVTRAQEAYWELVFARRDVEVKNEAIGLAREQLEMNRRMAAAGTLAPVEIVAAEAELERRRGDLFAARLRLTTAENAVKTLIAEGRESRWWEEEILPATAEAAEPPLTPLSDAIRAALQRRPELRALGTQGQHLEINRRLAENQTRPAVNLVAAYGQVGLAGSVRSEDNPFQSLNEPLFNRVNELSRGQGLAPLSPPSFGSLPPALIGSYGTTLANLFDTRFRTAQVGLEFDLNLRNRAAESALAQSGIEKRRLQNETTRTEQAIEAEVRNALEALETARERLKAARAGVRARRENLESETRRYQNGESTNFLVLTRQNEYAESRGAEVRASADLSQAAARYQRAVGGVLEAWRIRVPH